MAVVVVLFVLFVLATTFMLTTTAENRQKTDSNVVVGVYDTKSLHFSKLRLCRVSDIDNGQCGLTAEN